MFELWYWFWNELNKQVVSGDFWKAYINMGNLFLLIMIILPSVYAIFAIQPIARYLKWKENHEQKG